MADRRVVTAAAFLGGKHKFGHLMPVLVVGIQHKLVHNTAVSTGGAQDWRRAAHLGDLRITSGPRNEERWTVFTELSFDLWFPVRNKNDLKNGRAKNSQIDLQSKDTLFGQTFDEISIVAGKGGVAGLGSNLSRLTQVIDVSQNLRRSIVWTAFGGERLFTFAWCRFGILWQWSFRHLDWHFRWWLHLFTHFVNFSTKEYFKIWQKV